MKKYFLILSLITYLLFLISPVYAQTPTPQENGLQQIKDKLITNIASRVAQLNLVEKRGIIGKVTDSTNTQITISDLQGDTRFIDVDELTKFSSEDDKGSFGISDIKKGDTIGVLGLYNKDSRRILARFVSVISIPYVVNGGISEVNDKNYTITVATKDQKQIVIDVENTTKTYSYTEKNGYLRSGFSKIKDNTNIVVTGKLNSSDQNRMTASSIIFFPEIPAKPDMTSMSSK